MHQSPWGRLIASCQASEGEPLCAPEHILALSLSAIAGGASALRLEGQENIAAVRQSQKLPEKCPIIGLIKSTDVSASERLNKVYITSTFAEAKIVAEANADIVALDATGRPRPDGHSLAEMIRRIHEELDKPVWADVATVKEGLAAAEAGADIVSTTMFGYTKETEAPADQGPNFDLLEELARSVTIPVILEGRVWHPHEVTTAFEKGAYAVVVGSAITRPILITQRFVRAIPSRSATAAIRPALIMDDQFKIWLAPPVLMGIVFIGFRLRLPLDWSYCFIIQALLMIAAGTLGYVFKPDWFYAALAWTMFFLFLVVPKLLIQRCERSVGILNYPATLAATKLLRYFYWGKIGRFWQDLYQASAYYVTGKAEEGDALVKPWEEMNFRRRPRAARQQPAGSFHFARSLAGDHRRRRETSGQQ